MQAMQCSHAPEFHTRVADMRSPFIDETLYRRKVGKLICLTHTWPDISAAVSITSRFLSSPQEAHMAAVDQIL
jgi:hypothetical protein